MAGVKVVSARQSSPRRTFPRPAKIALLIATLWPVIYMGIFFVVWLRLVFAIMSPVSGASPDFPIALFVAHAATILFSYALIAFYIVHLFRNDRVEGNMKAVWAIVLFMGGFIAMPVYWYLYIWQDADQTPVTSQ